MVKMEMKKLSFKRHRRSTHGNGEWLAKKDLFTDKVSWVSKGRKQSLWVGNLIYNSSSNYLTEHCESHKELLHDIHKGFGRNNGRC